ANESFALLPGTPNFDTPSVSETADGWILTGQGSSRDAPYIALFSGGEWSAVTPEGLTEAAAIVTAPASHLVVLGPTSGFRRTATGWSPITYPEGRPLTRD